ncbi:MAG: two-component system response regulator, partial [Anaerolineae bacterium]
MNTLQNKTIFVVEDDAFNLAIIRTILRRQGASAPFDHWGDNTLSRILKFSTRLDMILLDLMLPDNISGHDIFESIRTQPSLEGVPVVAVSAADPSVEIPRTKEMGFSGFISKPIKHNLLPKQ